MKVISKALERSRMSTFEAISDGVKNKMAAAFKFVSSKLVNIVEAEIIQRALQH